MDVNIHIEFWTLIMKRTQYELYEQAAFKNARVKQGSSKGRGASNKDFFGDAHARRPDECNARLGIWRDPSFPKEEWGC